MRRRVNRIVDHLYGIVVILGKPKSRGSVPARLPPIRGPAVIDPNYFGDPGDMQTMVDGIRDARRLSKTRRRSAGLAQHGADARPVEPAATRRWPSGSAKNAITTYHFAGTARMGTERERAGRHPPAPQGVTGVRIADASAVPFTPVSAINAPSMLVGMRAARFLEEDGALGMPQG